MSNLNAPAPKGGTQQLGLVRAFAEFPLLPRLLRNINLQSNPRLRPDEWPEIFNEGGYNRDHIEEPDIPGNIELAEIHGSRCVAAGTALEAGSGRWAYPDWPGDLGVP